MNYLSISIVKYLNCNEIFICKRQAIRLIQKKYKSIIQAIKCLRVLIKKRRQGERGCV